MVIKDKNFHPVIFTAAEVLKPKNAYQASRAGKEQRRAAACLHR